MFPLLFYLYHHCVNTECQYKLYRSLCVLNFYQNCNSSHGSTFSGYSFFKLIPCVCHTHSIIISHKRDTHTWILSTWVSNTQIHTCPYHCLHISQLWLYTSTSQSVYLLNNNIINNNNRKGKKLYIQARALSIHHKARYTHALRKKYRKKTDTKESAIVWTKHEHCCFAWDIHSIDSVSFHTWSGSHVKKLG